MVKEFKTRTGAIFCDTEKKLEYLYVGDYGKENNIKADFLGLTKEINQVKHHEVDLGYKLGLVATFQERNSMNKLNEQLMLQSVNIQVDSTYTLLAWENPRLMLGMYSTLLKKTSEN